MYRSRCAKIFFNHHLGGIVPTISNYTSSEAKKVSERIRNRIRDRELSATIRKKRINRVRASLVVLGIISMVGLGWVADRVFPQTETSRSTAP